MRAVFRKLFADRRGATAVEYGLIVALIVIAVMAGIHALGGNTSSLWGSSTNKIAAVEP